MEKSGSTILLVLGILLVIGMGVGGYYLGRYIDVQEAKKVVSVKERLPEADTTADKTFSYENIKVTFTYPGDWTKRVYELVEGGKKVYEVSIVSPDGSYFYYNMSELAGKTTKCDANDPEGKVSGNSKCTFIYDGDSKFARYVDASKSSSELGEYWVVAEPFDSDKPGIYEHFSSNGFHYEAKNSDDLEELDKIMKSVVRK
jgi:hypothetical protein